MVSLLTESQIKHVAYRLIHGWVEYMRGNGGLGNGEEEEILGTELYMEAFEDFGDFTTNHEAIVVELDRIMSDLEEEAAKNDL
jgi:hypothetical protein